MGMRIRRNGVIETNSGRKFRVDCETEIASLAVADGAVTEDKIAADAVTAAKIATGAVGATEIAANAVITAKILDANVTTGKLAAGAATLPKITFTGYKTVVAVGADADPTPADITVAGPVAGDRLISVFGTLTAGGPLVTYTPGTDFEAVISVTGKINQLQGDLDAYTFVFILVPAAA